MDDILYISQSPLQLINNIEASLSLESGNGKHLIFIRDKQSLEAINAILKLLTPNNYAKYEVNKLLRLFFPLILRAETQAGYRRIYFGNTTSYTSFLINKIKAKDLVHVDDGTRTIGLLQLDGNESIFKRPALKIFDKSYLMRSNFFTYYARQAKDAGRSYIKNSLSEVGSRIAQLKNVESMVPANHAQKLFIGTNILKAYKGIERLFEDLDRHIGLNDCIYLMHRYDDESFMEAQAQRYKFKAFKINLPIELYFNFLWQKNEPSVWTFGSTAIDTLTLLSPKTRIHVIKLDGNRFKKTSLGDGFLKLYEHLEDNPMVSLHDFST